VRLLVVLAFVLFGVFVQHTVYRRVGAEEKLRRLNEELERRVQERTAQLEAANRELQAFNYTVSHDLRAPLRAIRHFSQAMLEQPPGSLDAGAQERIGAIQANAERLGRLIDDLLAFAGSARKDLHVSAFDMGGLVHTVFRDLRAAHPERDVALEVRGLPPAWGDVSMLREAMGNLLANAVKFTQPRASARVEVGGSVDAGTGEHVYYVKDNGVGFDPAYSHKLFNVFQRLHREEEFEGTGVGLAIVQRIIERHGGRVWAEGAVGQGATFFFSLPAPPAPARSAARRVGA
jgi:light-regulated signal transduction histidine kinase (bacteriophytochrome)